MSNILYQYSAKYFGSQLKRARYYRGYKTQSIVCNKLNISRQVWSLWEKGNRTPNLSQLTEVATILQVDINYFFIENADPRNFDLTLSYRNAPYAVHETGIQEEEINSLMPFVETMVTKELFKLFENCHMKKGIYAISVTRESGSSRAIREYTKVNSNKAVVVTPDSALMNYIESLEPYELIIFDDTEKLKGDIIANVISLFYSKLKGTIIFVGREIEDFINLINLSTHISEFLYTDAITPRDFCEIMHAALPQANNLLINSLKIETGIRLSKLYKILKAIKKRQQQDKYFVLTVDTLFEIIGE